MRHFFTAFLVTVCCSTGLIAKSPPATSAFSEISADYHRTPSDDGGYVPETYVVAEGTRLDENGTDDSISGASFWDVAKVISKALYESDYVPVRQGEQADLMIVINWGRTTPHAEGIGGQAIDTLASAMENASEAQTMMKKGQPKDGGRDSEALATDTQAAHELYHSARVAQNAQLEQMLVLQGMDEQVRAEANAYNARLLGYHKVLARANEYMNGAPARQHFFMNLLDELESPRYFVVLQAYDFETALKEKKRKLLWTTRFSISAKGRNFKDELESMAMASARIFGTDSEDLKRSLSSARVEFGELEFIGVDEEADAGEE